MNFPMQYPIFQFLYWLLNTSGLGGAAVMILGGGSLVTYLLILYWIREGAQADEADVYAYPTPGLHSPGHAPEE